MGLSVYPYAIIGVRIARAHVFENVRVKAFNHNHPETWVHDPVTGQLLWKNEERVRPPFIAHTQPDDSNIVALFDARFPVLDFSYEEKSSHVYIAATFVRGEVCASQSATLTALDLTRVADLQSALNRWNITLNVCLMVDANVSY